LETMRRYEGMFLFDTAASRDWAGFETEVRRLMDRIGANLLVCLKFDERKLAYEIQRRKRGTYVLTYFEALPSKIVDLERDAVLSESILRAVFLRAEGLTEEKLAAMRAHPLGTPWMPLSGDGRRGDDDGPPRRREDGYGYREERDEGVGVSALAEVDKG
jgi:small subunit ribosomal protein S6